MPKLNCTGIDTRVINALSSANIFSILDFILADVEKIESVTDLDAESILQMKHKFITDYSAQPVSGYELFLESKNNDLIKTGISGLDRLLEGGLSIKTLLEICGPAGSGKTQLVQSIAVNVAKEGAKVDFIHTKYDFSAHRCNVLGGGNLNDTESERALQNINVYYAKNFHMLMSTVDSISESYKTSVDKVRILVIDSLTAPSLPLVGLSSNKGLSMLNSLASSLKQLAWVHNVAVIVTNLGTKHYEDEDETSGNREESVIKPFLGKYWLHVPNTRVLISRDTDLKRIISIHKSDYLDLKKEDEVNITGISVY